MRQFHACCSRIGKETSELARAKRRGLGEWERAILDRRKTCYLHQRRGYRDHPVWVRWGSDSNGYCWRIPVWRVCNCGFAL